MVKPVPGVTSLSEAPGSILSIIARLFGSSPSINSWFVFLTIIPWFKFLNCKYPVDWFSYSGLSSCGMVWSSNISFKNGSMVL